MAPLLVADSFGKSFRFREVLKAATVWAMPGEVTALFGRNGSGKSTLLRVALGLVRADYGVLRYEGEAFLNPKLHKLARRGLMYLPDRGLLSRRRTLRWHHRVLELQLARKPDLEATRPLLVETLMDKARHQMSGGERRRAELSLILARRPRCLLADEPMAGVAPVDIDRVSGAIRALADGGCAVVVTGHDVDPLMELADTVVWMVGGTTHWLGSPKEARDHFGFQQGYLGHGNRPGPGPEKA